MAISQKIINPAPFLQQNIKKNRYLKKVINYLEKVNLGLKGRDKVKYELLKHRTVYTAFDKAATLKVKPNLIGKTLVLKTGKDLVTVLIPGNKNLDKNKFKKLVNNWRKKQGEKQTRKIDFVSEKIIKNRFKGVKVGAVPSFGNLFKLPTFIDRTLINQPKIIINAGDYNWSIKIKGADFKKLIPDLIVGNFSKSKK
jgi:Ala-tRNA(Pro) deacylase